MNELYLLYLRKSRGDIALEAMGVDVLERHEQTLLALAKSMGLSIGGIYKEVASGDSISARPQMQKLLEEVEQGIWKGVLVMEVERLARGDTIDQGIVQRAFQISGTKIITPLKVYDPNNEFDEEYFEFGLFMSRREYKTIKRRMLAGRTAAVREGKFPFNRAPYGWRRVKLEHDKGWTLEFDQNEAPVVKTIFQLYTGPDRIGATYICKYLDERGIKPRTGDQWTVSTLTGILANPVNDKKVCIGKRKHVTKLVDGVPVKTRPRFSGTYDVIAEGLQPRLIDHDIFMEAQTYIGKGSKKPSESYGVKNPLAGLIVCSCCGKRMQRRPATVTPGCHGAPYDVLMCQTRGCQTIGAPLDLVERTLIDVLEEWVDGYQLDPSQHIDDQLPEKEALLSSAMSARAQIAKQQGNLYDLLEQGVYSKEVFLERSQQLQKRLEESEQQISSLEKDIECEKEKQANIVNFIPTCKNLLSNYWELSVADRNKALKLLIDCVEYKKTAKNKKGTVDVPTFELTLKPRIPRI